MVWLSFKNIKSTRPTKKLSEIWLGPFPILRKTSTIPNRYKELPPPILSEEEEAWEVSQNPDSRLKKGKLCYLVEWKVYSQDTERTTWEPADNLNNLFELVIYFHQLYPDKPGHDPSRALSFYGSWWVEELPEGSPTPGMHL
ncbi:hypothetical protein O181_050092 [Austropuccinia psidii MF-1]|uniref:Chromo domain-containing protein n=1 Tax=Austropuccinia psidii MF-1 TaxID=1389203 RepID=A0A9Q3E2Z9_9BASI|nr:hypothetical protein [Austropuccinia psidii MF-1]